MTHTVLVVDDSALIRKQVRTTLQRKGYEVVEAADGRAAIDVLEAGESPSVIVCDIHMPRMNGIEFMEALREGGNESVPVVMLTNEMQRQTIHRARQLGVVGWLLKPFKPDLLVAAVHRLTEAA